MAVERHFIVRGGETIYRVIPNPDGDSCNGSEGIVLQWSDDGGKEWGGTFFIAPEQMRGVAESIMEFAPYGLAAHQRK